MDDFRKLIYGVLIAFVLMLIVWISALYIFGCGFTLTCYQAAATPERTPIPTLIPATLPVPQAGAARSQPFNKCQVAAVNLIGAWVSAGYPEKDFFSFTDAKGTNCQATFKDVQPLFLENSLWFPGALACASCHQPDLTIASAQMDLSTYPGMLRGSRRTDPNAQGNDIFGGGVWANSKLYEMLFVKKMMPLGRPPEVPAEGPVFFAGRPATSAPLETTIQEATPTLQSSSTPTPTP